MEERFSASLASFSAENKEGSIAFLDFALCFVCVKHDESTCLIYASDLLHFKEREKRKNRSKQAIFDLKPSTPTENIFSKIWSSKEDSKVAKAANCLEKHFAILIQNYY